MPCSQRYSRLATAFVKQGELTTIWVSMLVTNQLAIPCSSITTCSQG